MRSTTGSQTVTAAIAIEHAGLSTIADAGSAKEIAGNMVLIVTQRPETYRAEHNAKPQLGKELG
jgi:hypothetical protein